MERIEEEGLRERLRKPVVHQQKRSSDPRLWDNYQNPGPRSRVIWPQMLLDAQSIELRPLKFLRLTSKSITTSEDGAEFEYKSNSLYLWDLHFKQYEYIEIVPQKY